MAILLILLVLPEALSGGIRGPEIEAEQVLHSNSVRIAVIDEFRKEDFLTAKIRFPYYDPSRKSYLFNEGSIIRLQRTKEARFEVVYQCKFDGIVHSTTALIEYVFNNFPEHHNNYTRSVTKGVSFFFH